MMSYIETPEEAADYLRELADYFAFKDIDDRIGLPCRATARRLRDAAGMLNKMAPSKCDTGADVPGGGAA
jgi:hypothetical protein